MSDYPQSLDCDIPGLSLVDMGPGHRGKRYKARAWDKHTRKHDTRSFSTLEEARTFGRTKVAKFELRLDTAGAISISSSRDDFMAYLVGKRIGQNQIDKYAMILDRLVEDGKVDSLKSTDLIPRTQAWLNSLRCGKLRKRSGLEAPGLSATTKLRYVVMLKAFGEWVRKHKEQFKNPFELLVAPSQNKVSKDIFSIDECQAMVSDQGLRHPHGLFYAVAIYSGLRQQELAWLRGSAIRWNQKRIKVSLADAKDVAEGVRLSPEQPLAKHVKGNKEREAIMPDELAEILAKIVPAGDGYLFPESYRTMDSHQYNRALASLMKHVGHDRQERTTHSTRHTNVCLCLASGLDSALVKEHVGHESVTTTSGYARYALTMKEQAKGWAGEIRLRAAASKCNGSATGRSTREQAGADAVSSPIDPEDDLSDCHIVILPEHSPLFAHAGCDSVYPTRRTHNPEVLGSSPSRPTMTTSAQSESYDEDEAIGNPS